MAPTTSYRDAQAPDDNGCDCDMCFLFLVPCVAIGRGARLAGSSRVWAVTVAALAAVLFAGGFIAYAMYITSTNLDALSDPDYQKLMAYAWLWYVIGPLLDVPVLFLGSILTGISCDLGGECDARERAKVDQRRPWLIGSILMFMSVSALALHVRSSLIRRFQLPEPENCGSSCCVACGPLCSVATTMAAARKAHARDELPAYAA